jgi:hypothetical protein
MNRVVLLAAGLGGLTVLCSPAQAAPSAPCPVAVTARAAAPVVQPPCDAPAVVPCERGEAPCVD